MNAIAKIDSKGYFQNESDLSSNDAVKEISWIIVNCKLKSVR